MPYIRVGIYSIKEIREIIQLWNPIPSKFQKIDGFKVKAHSSRYNLFLENTICVSCNLKGKYFALERSVNKKLFIIYKKYGLNYFLKYEKHYFKDDKTKLYQTNIYHFNLYTRNKYGNEILMTRDHIVPKSKGGKNHISNYQVMCQKCNVKKDNKIIKY